MWQSIAHSTNPAEYRAYLETFPERPVRRSGAATRSGRIAASRTAARATGRAHPAAARLSAGVWLRPAHASVRLVDGVVLDLDASALRKSSNLRIAVVRVGTPETIADMNDYLDNSSSVSPTRLHLTVPSGPSGVTRSGCITCPLRRAPVLAARAGGDHRTGRDRRDPGAQRWPAKRRGWVRCGSRPIIATGRCWCRPRS